jgi:hypothetical protein
MSVNSFIATTGWVLLLSAIIANSLSGGVALMLHIAGVAIFALIFYGFLVWANNDRTNGNDDI